jgi:hypothetical protein
METMKGSMWLQTVQYENLHFDTAIDVISSEEERARIQKQFHDAAKDTIFEDIYQSGDIRITPGGTYSLKWRWGSGPSHHAAAVQSYENKVWAVEADEEGYEVYTLSCYSKKGLIWRNTMSIGPYLCVRDGICYVVEATSELRYGRCVSIDAETGKKENTLFTEPSLKNNLSLVPGENGCIFLESDNSGTKALYVLEGEVVKRIGETCVSFVPVGYASSDSRDVCFFGRIDSFASPWSAFGEALENMIVPVSMRKYGIDLYSLTHRIMITSAGGVRRIYRCSENTTPQKVDEIIGSIHHDTYGLWEGRRKSLKFIYTIPGETSSLYELEGGRTLKGKVYAKHSLQKAKSKDRTVVPYVLVQTGETVKGLMVVIYGGYGIPTGLGTTRWKPYLDAGWAIAFGLIRGGGDFGDEWADAARTYKKWKSVEDTVAVIKAAQIQTGLDWKRTCIYGRSAGGYTLGAVVAHYGGEVVGGAYTEVPYVDVLRTTSTPSLPLTILEYNEFGNPLENPRDLKTIRELSPVDALPDEGAPAVFVLARTSLNDREVLPYETVKWVQRLRGSLGQAEEKYLSITGGHGHFVRGVTADKQRGDDFILLNKWLGSRV